MDLPIYLVDAFSDGGIGSGNPAAVCLLPAAAPPVSDAVRQTIAAELNQSETAFIEPLAADAGAGGLTAAEAAVHGSAAEVAGARAAADLGAFSSHDTFRLRWFTPQCEVPLCGHATLASAAVLFQELGNPATTLRFQTLSGTLAVKRLASTSSTSTSAPLLEMSLPLAAPNSPLPPCLQPGSNSLAAVLAACTGGLPVADVRYTNQNDLDYAMIVLQEGTTRQELEGIRPDYAALLAAAPMEEVHGFTVTTKGEPGGAYDFYSRFFGPQMGINEDSVTGSAHCVLGPYWAGALGGSRHELRARQCSPRGGDVHVRLEAATDGTSPGRVHVSGPAAVVMRGALTALGRGTA